MERIRAIWHQAMKIGLLGGIAAVLMSLIGMVEVFSHRQIVHDVISMGHALLLVVGVMIAYFVAKRTSPAKMSWILLNTICSGLLITFLLVLFVLLGTHVDLRLIFINASPELYDLLTLGGQGGLGLLILFLLGGVIGALVGIVYMLPSLAKKVLLWPVISVFSLGVLQDLFRPMFTKVFPNVTEWFLTADGLTIKGVLVFFVTIAVCLIFWSFKGENTKQGWQAMPKTPKLTAKIILWVILAAFLLYLPHFVGIFLSEVFTIVGIYILLGLGLNIVVGYAGLLDLGYVAFFAIGAYVTGLLTSPEILHLQWSLWAAIPVAIFFGILAGVLLGVPVLKMRGDYLAIATMGFGEIIRILVVSDALKPWLGGSLGIGLIGKGKLPLTWLFKLFGSDYQYVYVFQTPKEIYYMIIVGCLIAVFLSIRLKDSRLGRAWKAMREDEDVAQAMGINLVSTKLLAFGTGAAFSALGGAIFASKLGSIYPQSFNILVSINVVCLIIFGGMGNIPGVIVGSAALVGLPELLREFAEYRYLVYGFALVVMMLVRPEGLWPEAIRKRELHEGAVNGAAANGAVANEASD
jgi:branched-chain amino acid transport system permease protein